MPKINENKRKERKIKVLAEKIEKITGKKVLLKEDVKDYENAYNSLRGAIRAAGLGEFIKIARTSNYILIDLLDVKKGKNLKDAVTPALEKRGFKLKQDRKLKGNIYFQFIDPKNTKIFIQKPPDSKIAKDYSQYIVRQKGSFFVDSETDDEMVEPGQKILFTYKGKKYIGKVTDEAFGRDNNVYRVEIL